MKIYKNQSEVEKDIKDGVLTIEGDVCFECNISINASIKVIAGDINALNINAYDINAGDINAYDINAGDINAGNIKARNIKALGYINALNINAWDINAYDINAWDINAYDINAYDILYYAFCCVYNSITCTSIKAIRRVYQEPICLDGKLEIKKDDTDLSGEEVEVKIKGKTYKAVIK